MLFTESKQEREADRIGNRSAHRTRLMARLGDGREWEFTGNVQELAKPVGTCACGHTGLKFLFELRNARTGDMCEVGSSCIECYTEANPELVAAVGAALEAKLAEAAERRRAAKEAAQSSEVAAALARYTELAYRLDAILADGAEPFTYKHWDGTPATGFRQVRRVVAAIYYGWHTPDIAARRIADRREVYPRSWNQYKLKAAFLRAIKAEIAKVETLLAGPFWQ